jgi:hypothetical protein
MFLSLPHELIDIVLDNLAPRDLVTLRLVSKVFVPGATRRGFHTLVVDLENNESEDSSFMFSLIASSKATFCDSVTNLDIISLGDGESWKIDEKAVLQVIAQFTKCVPELRNVKSAT